MELTTTLNPLHSCTTEYDLVYEYGQYIFQNIYLIPTFCVHVTIFLLIFCSRKRQSLRGSFYILYGTLAGIQIFYQLYDLLLIRPFAFVADLCPFALKMFSPYSYKLTFPYAAGQYVNFASIFCQLFISINRLTSIASPVNHRKIWKSYLKLVIAAIFILPCGLIFHVAPAKTKMNAFRNGATLTYQKIIPWARLSTFNFFLSVFALVVIGMSTIATVILVCSLPNRIKSAERQLCFVGIVISTSIAINCGVAVVFYYDNTSVSGYLFQLYTSDLGCVCNAWSIVIMSSEMQRQFSRIWLRGRINSNSVTQVSTISGRSSSNV